MPQTLRLFCFALMLALPLAGNAPAYANSASPEVGQAPPHDLALPDQNGQRMNFMSRARKKGLIVLFTRSVGW